jgi:hypothetical protein
MNDRTYGAFVLSVSLPRDPMFRRFVADYVVPPREINVDDAAEFIKLAVGIDSRNALKTDRRAQQRFHEILMKQYAAWKAWQEEHA